MISKHSMAIISTQQKKKKPPPTKSCHKKIQVDQTIHSEKNKEKNKTKLRIKN